MPHPELNKVHIINGCFLEVPRVNITVDNKSGITTREKFTGSCMQSDVTLITVTGNDGSCNVTRRKRILFDKYNTNNSYIRMFPHFFYKNRDEEESIDTNSVRLTRKLNNNHTTYLNITNFEGVMKHYLQSRNIAIEYVSFNDYHGNENNGGIFQVMKQLYDSNMGDIKIVFQDGQTRYVISHILAARCDFFKSKFFGEINDVVDGVIKVDYDFDAFMIVLHAIYTGVLPKITDMGTAIAVYELCNFFQFTDVIERLKYIICSNITCDNVVKHIIECYESDCLMTVNLLIDFIVNNNTKKFVNFGTLPKDITSDIAVRILDKT